MKKFLLVSSAFLLFIVNGLAADLSSNLDTFVQIECLIEPSSRSTHNHKKHRTLPHIRTDKGTSTNWSGYAVATSLQNPIKGSITEVSGSWTVPHLSPSNGNTYCAVWVGIDGYSSNTVEQIGTEHDWRGGSQKNYAWFEMYPKGSFNITGFPVNASDHIGAEVKFVGSNTFQLTLVNYTQNVFTIVPSSFTQSATALRNSAEWIVEAPFSTKVLPLAHFGTIAFTDCLATVNGISGSINSTKRTFDRITMKTPKGIVKSLPSTLAAGGKSFSLTWKHQ